MQHLSNIFWLFSYFNYSTELWNDLIEFSVYVHKWKKLKSGYFESAIFAYSRICFSFHASLDSCFSWMWINQGPWHVFLLFLETYSYQLFPKPPSLATNARLLLIVEAEMLDTPLLPPHPNLRITDVFLEIFLNYFKNIVYWIFLLMLFG